MTNVNVMGVSGITAPFMAVKENGYFQVGDEVQINDINSLSYSIKGPLIGLIHRGEDKIPMALVQTLEGAPPVRILMTKLKRLKPTKFWMICADIDGQFVRLPDDHVDFRTAFRNGTLAPAVKYYNKEEAIEKAKMYTSRYGQQALILESVEFVSKETGEVGKV